MRKFIFNAGEFETLIPESFEEVNFGQFLALREMKDPSMIDIVAFFMGVPVDVVSKSKDVSNFYEILNSLSWARDDIHGDEIEKPAFIKYDGRTIIIPRDIDYCTIAQTEDAKMLMRQKKEDDYVFKNFPEVIAVFMDQLIFGEHNKENHEKTIPIIQAMPVMEVIGLGNFFIQKLIELSLGTTKGLSPRFMILRRLRLALKSLRHGDS